MLLESLADTSHEEHDSLADWVGDDFDPTEFDIVATNVVLQRI
jgi:hypothetical protein